MWYTTDVRLMETLMNRLRELRKEKGCTIREISQYLFCDYSLYSKYEREERMIPIDYLIKLSDFFDTNIDYILGRTVYRRKLPTDGTD